MKKVTAIITGSVCEVGYRNIVYEAAYRNSTKGYVKYTNFRADGNAAEEDNIEYNNTDQPDNRYPHAVEVVAEGNKSDLKKFFEDIKIRRRPVYVEEISQEWEESEGEYSDFTLVREDFQYELYEGFNKIVIMDEEMDSEWLSYKELTEEESSLPENNSQIKVDNSHKK